MIVLRPDQQQLENEVFAGWQAGNINMLAQAATGFGKSIVVSDIALKINNFNLKQAIIAHRNELVLQMSHHIARCGIHHRIIGSNETIRQITYSHREEFGQVFLNPHANCTVAGIDTINARYDDLKSWGRQVEYWTIDEAHHVLTKNKWGNGVSLFPNARGLGVTASPGRPDGQGLGRAFDGVFDAMVFGPPMRWLIENGSLSEYEILCPQSDLQIDDDAITDSGDYSLKKLKAASEKSRIVGDVVREYAKYAIFKRAICFATDVDTANKIANQFNEAGIPAASVSAKTPTIVREKYIKDFKNGKIYVLVNVDLFDEGFDVPACECVIMARPTASLVKYLQMFGRALRPMIGKPFGLIIDHVSNVIRHGLPDKPREWSLGRRDKRGKQERDPEDIPLCRCLSCAKPYAKSEPACPYCGAEPPLPSPRERTIEMVEGDLVLLDRAALDAKRKAMEIESAGSVASRAGYAAGPLAAAGAAARQTEKITAQKQLSDTIALWAGHGRASGQNDRNLYRKFYYAMGCDVLDALRADRSRQEFEDMTNKINEWMRKDK